MWEVCDFGRRWEPEGVGGQEPCATVQKLKEEINLKKRELFILVNIFSSLHSNISASMKFRREGRMVTRTKG